MLSEFSGHKYVNMETVKKNGSVVRTPVWFVQDDYGIYVRTYSNSGKVKRLRANGRLRVAPCDFEGRLLGDWVEMNHEFLSGEEEKRIEKMFFKKYGIQARLTSILAQLKGKKYIHLRLTKKTLPL